MGDEEVAGARVRQAEDHALLLKLVESDHAAAGKGVVRRDGEDKIVRIEQEIVNAWVGHTPLDDGEIQFIGLEHCIKIIYGVRNHFNACALVFGTVLRQSLGDSVALGGMRDADSQMRCPALFVPHALIEVVIKPDYLFGEFHGLLALPGDQKLAVCVLKELHSQLTLERLDMLADSRLRYRQLLRRAGIVPALVYFQQCVQLIIYHRAPP